MAWIELPVDILFEANWNYKKNKKSLQKKLTNNIKKNGLIENLIVRELGADKYEVVNGNHRLQSLKSLNIKTAMCYNLGTVGLSTAKRIALETNEIKFSSDRYKLSEIIKGLLLEFNVDELSLTLPFDETEFTELSTFSDLDENLDIDFGEDDFDLDDVEVESKASTSSFSSIEKLELMVEPDVYSRFQRFIKKFKKINNIAETADDTVLFNKLNEKLKKLLPSGDIS